MPRFKCINKECKDFNKEELIPNVRFKWNPDSQELESDEGICKKCGKQRIVVGDTVIQEGKPISKVPWHKAQNDRNYDNKSIKKYDYDSKYNVEYIKG